MGEGLCKVNKPEIKFGEEAKWTYVPVRECGVGLTGEWVLLEADEPGKDGLEATFRFSTDKSVINQKVYPSLTVKKGKMSTTVDCSRATVKVTNATVIQSSSSVVPPSSAVIKSSSSSSALSWCEKPMWRTLPSSLSCCTKSHIPNLSNTAVRGPPVLWMR